MTIEQSSSKSLSHWRVRNTLKAFTLSEVLISLVIIGIIAAITVPSIIQHTQNQQFKSALKKNYSVLYNAFNLAYGFDYDDFKDWKYGENIANTNTIINKLSKYLHIQKFCGHTYGCYTKEVKAKNGKSALWKDILQVGNENQTFTLNDGTAIAISIASASSIEKYGISKNLISQNTILIVGVDVNGLKKPNTLGKDIFHFALTERGLVPSGIDNNSQYCDNLSINYNYDCTAKVLREK